MNNIIKTSFILFTIILAFSCQKDCPEQNVDDLNALFFDFKLSGDNSFTEEMLDSVIMIRFQTETLDTLSFQADTFLYYQEGFHEDDYKIRISKNLPRYAETGAPFYAAYNYSIQSVGQDFEILITDIDLVGGYDEENCVYTNTTKSFVLQGDTIDVGGSVDYVSMGVE